MISATPIPPSPSPPPSHTVTASFIPHSLIVMFVNAHCDIGHKATWADEWYSFTHLLTYLTLVVLSCLVLSCLSLSLLSYVVSSCLVLSYPVLSHLAFSCLVAVGGTIWHENTSSAERGREGGSLWLSVGLYMSRWANAPIHVCVSECAWVSEWVSEWVRNWLIGWLVDRSID